MQIGDCRLQIGVAYSSTLTYIGRTPGASLEVVHYRLTVPSHYLHGRFTEAPFGLTKGCLRASSYLTPIKSVVTACLWGRERTL